MAPDQVHRIFTATLLIGVPGSGKTSLLGTYARYLWETHRKVLLLYSWDGGAVPTGLQALMKQGLIRFWRVRTRSAEGLGIETLYLATKGYWPKAINAETGETSPGVELVAPVTAAYTVRDKEGHVLSVLPARSLMTPTFCSVCKTMVATSEQFVTETVKRTKGFENVGGVAFDGLTSMTSVVMEHMDHARGQGQIGGEKPAFGGVVVSGAIKLGGNNRADVGFGQTRAPQFVNNSLSIPYLVEGPVFTALSMEATDEGGLPIVGAKLPGRAATDEASSWFGNVAEAGKTIDEAGREHFALFLRPFTDPQNRRHLLKTSASPTGLPDKLVDPIDQPWTQSNLGLVFKLLDEDLRQALTEEVEGAPGLAGTPTEYGEPLKMPPTPVASGPGNGAPAGSVPQGLPMLQASPTTTAMPAVSAVPTAVARSRRRVEEAPIAVADAPPPAAAAEPAPESGGPPPPPGMKPPQRAPGS